MKLQINNKELEFSFGLGFLGELLESTGKSMDEILTAMDKNPYRFIPLAMFHSTKYAYKRKGKDIDFDFYQFTDWIEQDGGLTDTNKSAIKFIEEFTNSLFKDVPQEEGKEEGDKKK